MNYNTKNGRTAVIGIFWIHFTRTWKILVFCKIFLQMSNAFKGWEKSLFVLMLLFQHATY